MSITENAGIPWGDVLDQTAMTCARLEVCEPYPGEGRDALAQSESEQIPHGPHSEHDLRTQWNAQADEFNQWESLDLSEQLAWAQARAIAADRNGRSAATPPAPEPEEVARCLADSLASFRLTQDPTIYPADHWSRRAATLLQKQQHLLGLAGAELDRFMERQPLNIIFTGPPRSR